MSENSEVYKLYQVMHYLTLNHNYRGVLLRGYARKDEVWLFNNSVDIYNIIRLTMSNLDSVDYDRERLEKCVIAISKQTGIRDPFFLDIHIGKGEPLDDEQFATLCMDVGYYKGDDTDQIFPGLKRAIHTVEDPNEEIKQIFSDINRNSLNIRKQKMKFLRKENLCTMILMAVSFLIYVLVLGFSTKYESATSMIFFGADYKMFTLGLHQYWRLITAMFVHGSFYHIFANMYSLYFLGTYVESRYGHLKFLILLFLSGIAGFLTAGILKENSLFVGMSGGLYGLMVIYVFEAVSSGFVNRGSIMSLLLVNLAINFYPNVCWQAHLGGAVIGILCYKAFTAKGFEKGFAYGLAIVVVAALFVKYNMQESILPVYGGTDADVIKMINDLGLKNYAQSLSQRLLQAYQKYAR